MIYGYARVSTRGQAKEGNSLGGQIEKLIERGVPEENIFHDTFTGTKLERPNFDKLLSILQPEIR
jgi:DNA invertase Pin-like site-specific DNA recombinase